MVVAGTSTVFLPVLWANVGTVSDSPQQLGETNSVKPNQDQAVSSEQGVPRQEE